MWQHNYEPIGGSLGLSALAAAIPILVLFVMLGVHAEAGLDGRDDRARLGAGRRAPRLPHAVLDGDHLDAVRRGVRHLSHRLDRLQLDHAVSARGRYRQVRDHQGLGRRPDQRSAPAGDVHRLLVRRVHRRRGRLRRAGRRVGRDARRPGILAVLCRRHLPARQHGAGGVRLDRHPHHDARQRHGHPVDAAERDDRPAVRDDLGHHSGVSRRRDGGPEARARGVAGDPDLRRLVCGHAVLRLELHRARADRHPQLARLHFGDGAGAEVLEAADDHAARRRQGSDDRAEKALRQRGLRGVVALPAARGVRADVGRGLHQSDPRQVHATGCCPGSCR